MKFKEKEDRFLWYLFVVIIDVVIILMEGYYGLYF